MLKTTLFNGIGTALVAVLVCSCATRATLQGGPKDTEAPQCLKSEPANQAVRVEKPQIRLTFNEYFSLQSPTDSIRITPAQQKAPQYTVKGKTLWITLKDSLLPNTTYHVDVEGSVIKDITEGNAVPAFSYVFSTGETLDSGFLYGEVLDCYTLEPVARACVLLYTSADDSCPLRDAPDFFTLSDTKGRFRFEHIPAREYSLYALLDKNFNRRFDQADEGFAFLPENRKVEARPLPVTDTLTVETHRLLLFQERPEKLQFMQQLSPEAGIHRFVFNRPAENVRLQPMEADAPDFVAEYSPEKDTVSFYCCDTAYHKRMDFRLLFGEDGMDTVKLIPFGLPSETSPKGKAAVLGSAARIPLKAQSKRQVEIHDCFRITFDFPLRSADTSAFLLLKVHQKTRDTQVVTSVQLRMDSLRPRTLELDHPLSARYDYTLFVPESACVACNGRYNDSLALAFAMKGKKEYGGLKLLLRLPEKQPYIVQLVNPKGQVMYVQSLSPDAQAADTGSVFFPFVEEGGYRLRVIGDQNGNNRWDSGKYRTKQQAEPVFFPATPLNVKKRWITEETIEVLFK